MTARRWFGRTSILVGVAAVAAIAVVAGASAGNDGGTTRTT